MNKSSSHLYNCSWTYKIGGHLDLGELERCIQLIIEFFPSFRTYFTQGSDGTIEKAILKDGKSSSVIQYINFEDSSLSQKSQKKAAINFLKKELVINFELNGGILYRFYVTSYGVDKHCLMLVQHHLVSDAISGGIFTKALSYL
uniref:condensation domain-containing protein n=1 Tax=Endozoicomonas sp. Mp262 TaxID=2919499 RepID=UPI00351AD51F